MERKDFIIPLNTPSKFYQSVIDIINSSQKSDHILCNYFVVRYDEKGRDLLNALANAAKRGARVQLIVDSYGSLHKGDNGTEYPSRPLTLNILRGLTSLGVECFVYRHIFTTKFFHPYNICNWTNYSRRNHNKNFLFNLESIGKKGLIIGDSQWANEHFNHRFRGNNVYIENDHIFKKCYDYHEVLLNSDQISKAQELENFQINDNECPWGHFAFSDYRKSNWYAQSKRYFPKSIKYVSNEINFKVPSKRKTIQDHEIQLMDRAHNDIWYATPYFCPDKTMRKTFVRNRNKNLKILIAKFRNDPFIPYGTEVAAKKLIFDKVNIFEYQGRGNIHYKDLIVDDFSFIKTANGEGRSRFYNLETGVIIQDKEYARLNKINIQKDLNQASILSPQTNYISESHFAKKMAKQALCPLFYHHL